MAFTETPNLRFGIDLGGTKIELVALQDEAIIFRRRTPTPAGDYQQTISAICQLVDDAKRETGLHGTIGVGIPGTISPDHGRIKNANSTCLIGEDFRGDLSDALGQEVRLANDADCFTLSEATDGAGRDFRTVFGVILGTGVGGGFVWDGRLLSGPNAIAGEWGHNPLPWAGPEDQHPTLCYCGQLGCLETWLSGPAVSRQYTQLSGTDLPASEIAARIDTDVNAAKIMDQFCERLAKGLASVINILDPEVIVIGGGLSNLPLIYREVPQRWQKYVFSDQVNTLLQQAMHGDSSGVRGAAWLWPV